MAYAERSTYLTQAMGVPFSEWMDELEGLMRDWHAKHGNLPYDLPLDRAEDNANICCWRDSYDDGMTPEEAFASDRAYWEE